MVGVRFESALFRYESNFAPVCSVSWNSLKYTNRISMFLYSSTKNWGVSSSSLLETLWLFEVDFCFESALFRYDQFLDLFALFHGIV